MIKDILAVVEDPLGARATVKAAIALAEAHGAHLEIAVLTPGPVASAALVPFGALYLPDAAMAEESRSNVKAVTQLASKADCPVTVFGLYDDIAWLAGDVRRSRQLADLILVGSPATWRLAWLRRHVVETLILTSGTPMMTFSPERQTLKLAHAVLGWKPSAEANRAVHDLVAVLEPGARVDIATVTDQPNEAERRTGEEVVRHLSRHGFAPEMHWLDTKGLRDSEVLQNFAIDVGASLLAIGGFAHARVREIILGGVTRDIAEQPRIPTLISH